MNTELWLPQLGFLAAFVVLWLAVTFLLSYISGWAFLAEHYRAARPYAGHYVRVRASQMGPLGPFGGARNALNVAVDPEGLHLRMFILFRINCRDLFIPWRDVTVSRGKSYFQDYIELHFRQAPRIGLRIFGKTGEIVRELAGPLWPPEPPLDVVRR